MSGSGASSSGTQKYEWSDDMKDRLNNALNRGERLSLDGQYQPFQGQRYAPLAYNQQAAISNMGNFANLAPSPVSYTDVYGKQHQGSMNMATDQTQATLGGDYMPGGIKGDPFSLQQNPWTSAAVTAGSNKYGGDSPYASSLKQQGMQDIVANYQSATEPELTRAAVMAGSFGGSQDQKARANAQTALGKSLTNYGNQFDQSQYERSAGLEQQRLQNDLQAQTTNKQIGFQGGEDFLNRGSSAYQNERGRQQGAAGMGYGEQGLTLDRINSLLQTGGLQQGQDQKGLDFNYQQNQEALNWPYKQQDILWNLYTRALGGTSPSVTAYGGGGSNTSNILAGLLGGASLFGGS